MHMHKTKSKAKSKAEQKKELVAMIEESVPDIIESLLGIVRKSKSDKDRIQAAQVLLDRCFGRPHNSVQVNHNQPIDSTAIMSALADQARGVLIDVDNNGVQRLMITPGKQLDSRTVFDVETLQSEDFESGNS